MAAHPGDDLTTDQQELLQEIGLAGDDAGVLIG